MKKINVAELLKDCPRDMELDCTMYDNLYFDSLNADYYGTINCYTLIDGIKTSINFTKYGTFNNHMGAKCVIFPKGKTTWEGFVPSCQFKDGDIAVSDKGDIHLLRTKDSSYCAYRERWEGLSKFDETPTTSVRVVRLATEEEKQKLFQAIKDNGYKWNAETKDLEELIQPKFNAGDRIKWIKTGIIYEIIKIIPNYYITRYLGSDIMISFNDHDEYELVPDKFDINTLIPFESRVLARDDEREKWHPALWGFYDVNSDFPYKLIGDISRYCIPYEGNEHLLGKTDDCDEYFKTWK